MFLSLLAAYTAEGRRGGSTTGSGYAPKAFADDTRSEGVTKKSFADAMNKLFETGKIRIEELGPVTRRVRKLVIV